MAARRRLKDIEGQRAGLARKVVASSSAVVVRPAAAHEPDGGPECQPNGDAPLLRDEGARRKWVEEELFRCCEVWCADMALHSRQCSRGQCDVEHSWTLVRLVDGFRSQDSRALGLHARTSLAGRVHFGSTADPSTSPDSHRLSPYAMPRLGCRCNDDTQGVRSNIHVRSSHPKPYTCAHHTLNPAGAGAAARAGGRAGAAQRGGA